MIHLAYSLTTGRVRGWTVFTPDEIARGCSRPAGRGEGILIIQPESYGDLNTLQALVTQTTGKIPSNDRYIMVDQKTGQIVSAHIADPACDDPHPGCDMYPHAFADPAWTFDTQAKQCIPPKLSQADTDALTAAKQAKGIPWTAPPNACGLTQQQIDAENQKMAASIPVKGA